ncbi:MAG: trypsin-like peptidase domain-containing protein [Burkholderiaceae bacterium]
MAGADEVTVKLTDRREYTARVLGLDKRTDVAVLKIDADRLPTVKLGNPADLEPGEWVLAVETAVRLREHGDGRRGQRQGPQPAR